MGDSPIIIDNTNPADLPTKLTEIDTETPLVDRDDPTSTGDSPRFIDNINPADLLPKSMEIDTETPLIDRDDPTSTRDSPSFIDNANPADILPKSMDIDTETPLVDCDDPTSTRDPPSFIDNANPADISNKSTDNITPLAQFIESDLTDSDLDDYLVDLTQDDHIVLNIDAIEADASGMALAAENTDELSIIEDPRIHHAPSTPPPENFLNDEIFMDSKHL
jgi:hypothetical protein